MENQNAPTSIVPAHGSEYLPIIGDLFSEYAASLGFSLCFQNFDSELAGLPGAYAPPRGALLLAKVGNTPAGCVALRPATEDTCEMKRLFVRPGFRNQRVGLSLVTAIVEEARRLGYHSIRLDTVSPQMDRAIAIYRAVGFSEIPAFDDHPIPGSIWLGLTL